MTLPPPFLDSLLPVTLTYQHGNNTDRQAIVDPTSVGNSYDKGVECGDLAKEVTNSQPWRRKRERERERATEPRTEGEGIKVSYCTIMSSVLDTRELCRRRDRQCSASGTRGFKTCEAEEAQRTHMQAPNCHTVLCAPDLPESVR